MKFKEMLKIKDILDDKDENVIYTLKAKVSQVVRLQNVTIFTVDDGNQTLQLVKYLPGQSAYPEIEQGCVVTFSFKKTMYEGRLQGQIVDVKKVEKNIQENVIEKVKNLNKNDIFEHQDWRKLEPSLKKVSDEILNAINQKRPIILSHHADCDGYASAYILENAILYKIKQRQPDLKFIHNYYTRNASKTPYYEISDATKDISFFQSNLDRVENKTPLIIIIDNGSTCEDILAIKKAKIFGADFVVVDHHDPGKLDEHGKSQTCELVLAHSNPHLVGLSKEFSTSMLSFRLAYYLTEEVHHDVFSATLGAVADKCQGEPFEKFVQLSNEPLDYLQKLGNMVNLEVFFTKYAYGELPIKDLLKKPSQKQKDLVNLYENYLEETQKELFLATEKFKEEKSWGKFQIILLDADKLTLWNDFFSIGKITGFVHNKHETTTNKFITLAYSDSMIVYRVYQSEKCFDGNKLVQFLKENVSFARISGGGHDVAGSIKFIPAAKKIILEKVEEFIKQI